MIKKHEAYAQIREKIVAAQALIRDCEVIALANKVDFYFETPCGRSEEFDGVGNKDYYGNNGNPTGWDHSQC